MRPYTDEIEEDESPGVSVQVGKAIYQLTSRRAPKGHPDSTYHKPNRMARREPKRIPFNQPEGEGV